MIRDMRRGHVPSVERLRSLCEVLDLEFFVGPRRLRREAREGAPDILLSTLERTAQDLAQLTADAGGNPVSDDLWSVLASRRAIASPAAEGESTPAAPSPWSDPPPSDRIPKAGMEREEFGWTNFFCLEDLKKAEEDRRPKFSGRRVVEDAPP